MVTALGKDDAQGCIFKKAKRHLGRQITFWSQLLRRNEGAGVFLLLWRGGADPQLGQSQTIALIDIISDFCYDIAVPKGMG